MPLVRMDRWREIRAEFTEDEKAALNRAIVGQTICPAGVTVDLTQLPDRLAAKLESALRRRPHGK